MKRGPTRSVAAHSLWPGHKWENKDGKYILTGLYPSNHQPLAPIIPAWHLEVRAGRAQLSRANWSTLGFFSPPLCLSYDLGQGTKITRNMYSFTYLINNQTMSLPSKVGQTSWVHSFMKGSQRQIWDPVQSLICSPCYSSDAWETYRKSRLRIAEAE